MATAQRLLCTTPTEMSRKKRLTAHSVRELSSDTAILAVQGPGRLRALCAAGFAGALRELPYFAHMSASIAGVPCRIGRLGYTGERGFEIVLPRDGLRMVDMPYWSFHVSPEQAVENAGRFVAQANAEVMKCEGNRHHVRNIEAIIKAGIPVQGHIGITPMRMAQLGGFIAQGKTSARALELVDDARQMVDAGCFSIMCEVTTEEVVKSRMGAVAWAMITSPLANALFRKPATAPGLARDFIIFEAFSALALS